MSEQESIRESDLALLLGVDRSEVVNARAALQENTHWQREHRYVVYSPAGVEAVKAWLVSEAQKNTPPAETAPVEPEILAEKETPPAPPPPAAALAAPLPARTRPRTAMLKCMKVFTLNPRLVLATLPGSDVPERVAVRDNKHFRPGMQFEAVQLGDLRWALSWPLPRHPRDRRFWPETVTPAAVDDAGEDHTDPRPPRAEFPLNTNPSSTQP